MNIEIANRLVQLRKENGLSQEALAAKLGISRQAISKWERAEASPDTDNLMALAQLYGLTLDALLNTSNDAYILNGKAEPQEQPAQPPREKTPMQQTADKLLKFPFPLVIVIVYLIFGFVFDWWHPSWLVFLLIPIYYHGAGALEVRKKKARLLAMPIPEVIVLLYLMFGLLGGIWSPTWILFLLIPLYYWLISCFYKNSDDASDSSQEENK